MRENRGRQYISGLSKTFFTFFSEFVYGGLCFFQPKTFSIPRGIIPQHFSSLVFAVSQELGNKQTHRLTHSLTYKRFYRVIHLYGIPLAWKYSVVVIYFYLNKNNNFEVYNNFTLRKEILEDLKTGFTKLDRQLVEEVTQCSPESAQHLASTLSQLFDSKISIK